MSENVIHFGTRRPLAQVTEEAEKAIEQARDADREAHLEAIDNLRRLVEQDKVRGLILIGRHVELGVPYQDVIFPMRVIPGTEEYGSITSSFCPPEEAFFYTGLLEAMKLEFADMAQMAPCLMPTGEVLNPHDEIAALEDEIE